jgi:ATP-binding cassette subfamily D (ALD) protein 2
MSGDSLSVSLSRSTKQQVALVGVAVSAIGALSLYAARQASKAAKGRKAVPQRSTAESKPQFNNKQFYAQLSYLLRIVLPSWKSREAALLALHTLSLVARTFLSLYVAHLDGALVRALVARRLGLFVQLMAQWMLIALPSSLCNALIKYLESMLATAFRSRLTAYATEHYMRREVYYRVLNLDDRVRNADQRLTDDLSAFCTNLAHVHSQLSKPILDVVMSTLNLMALGAKQNLRAGAGSASGLVAAGVIYVSATLLRMARPPLGALVAEQAALEGELRHVHARLIANAEQVGFYRGHKVESRQLMSAYDELRDHQERTEWLRVPYGTLESFLMKYVWSAAGLTMLAVRRPLIESGCQRCLTVFLGPRVPLRAQGRRGGADGRRRRRRHVAANRQLRDGPQAARHGVGRDRAHHAGDQGPRAAGRPHCARLRGARSVRRRRRWQVREALCRSRRGQRGRHRCGRCHVHRGRR